MDQPIHSHPAAETAEIGELVKTLGDAMRSKDAAKVMSCGAKGGVHFTLAPPLITPDDGGKGLSDWFATWDGPLGYDFRDLEIHAGKRVGFCHALVHMTGKKKDSGPVALWFRLTLGLEKLGGQDWKFVHWHESVPFYMDGSLKAAVDLKP